MDRVSSQCTPSIGDENIDLFKAIGKPFRQLQNLGHIGNVQRYRMHFNLQRCVDADVIGTWIKLQVIQPS